jgi:hypothetical protein
MPGHLRKRHCHRLHRQRRRSLAARHRLRPAQPPFPPLRHSSPSLHPKAPFATRPVTALRGCGLDVVWSPATHPCRPDHTSAAASSTPEENLRVRPRLNGSQSQAAPGQAAPAYSACRFLDQAPGWCVPAPGPLATGAVSPRLMRPLSRPWRPLSALLPWAPPRLQAENENGSDAPRAPLPSHFLLAFLE